MKIAYNASAVLANNSLYRNDSKLSLSMQRLSSGLKITGAKDNPAGLAMARRMNSQINGLNIANMNAKDAVSISEIADGAMAEVHDMLQRINELAIKASNDIILDDDRQMIQGEVAALKAEITRIANTTEFNGQKILDGSFDLRGYTYDVNLPTPGNPSAVDIKVAGYSDYVANGKYWLEDLYVEFNEAGNIILESVSFNSDPATFSPPYGDPGTNYVALPPDATVTAADGNVITITAAKGFELHLEIRRNDDNSTVIADPNGDRYAMEFVDPIYLDIVGFGAMDMQVGANEGQQLNIRIHRLSLENMGISNIDLSTYEGALDALGKMGKAVNYVSTARSHVGAYQNRLEHIISNLDISTENLTGAYSRIMDTDMATEMTNYTTYQILVQASTSMLAQANERPATVLQLLQ